jgi:phage tail sheath gpL-like
MAFEYHKPTLDIR